MSASSSALVLSLLLLVGAANFVIAAPAHHGPSTQAQCVALGLSTCPQPFDAVLPDPAHMPELDQHTRVIGFRKNLSSVPRGRDPHARRSRVSIAGREQSDAVLCCTRWTQHLPPQRLSATAKCHWATDPQEGQRVYDTTVVENTDKTLWTSRSVAKSVVSVLSVWQSRRG